MNVSVLGVVLVKPYQSSKYFALQTNMHTSELCEIAFLKKTIRTCHEKLSLMDKFKLMKQSSAIFLEHFELFQSSHFEDFMQVTSSDI